MSAKTILTISGLLCFALPSAATAQVACDKCDKVIILDQPRWECLLERLDVLSKKKTPVVFFTLSERQCPAARQIVVPDGNAVRQTKSYFQLSQKQIQCLKKISPKVQGPDYRIDFQTMCGR